MLRVPGRSYPFTDAGAGIQRKGFLGHPAMFGAQGTSTIGSGRELRYPDEGQLRKLC